MVSGEGVVVPTSPQLHVSSKDASSSVNVESLFMTPCDFVKLNPKCGGGQLFENS